MKERKAKEDLGSKWLVVCQGPLFLYIKSFGSWFKK